MCSFSKATFQQPEWYTGSTQVWFVASLLYTCHSSHAAQVVARNYSLCTHFGELDYANSIEEEKDKINDITRLQNLAKPLPAHVLVSLKRQLFELHAEKLSLL